jgi:hypothetical protein
MLKKLEHPLAITMWDFSWLERRWPGAGYENWDEVLDELKVRGYDAVRIDAYPHLMAVGPEQEWTLKPEWSVQDWGAPTLTKISHLRRNLVEFIRACGRKNILVALSTWFREDVDNHRMNIKSPKDMADIWISVLNIMEEEKLMEHILYVDLCNEFPISCWAPWLAPALGKAPGEEVLRASEEGTAWMRDSISALRSAYPNLEYCYSVCSEFDTLSTQDVSFMDLLEPHIWMAQWSDFYTQVGYNYERFSSAGYDNMVQHAETLYKSKPEYWQQFMYKGIDTAAQWSRDTGKPLVTTECWGIVDYKDWPLLNWDWIIELCELGVKHAASTGRWAAISTSNFCGPQFKGMWRDIEWHQRMTSIIHNAALPK